MKSLLLAGLFGLTTVVHTVHRTTPIATRVYTTPQSSRIVVHVVKPEGREYRIRVLDQKGAVLHVSRVTKSRAENWHAVNLGALPDGLYTVELDNAKDRVLKRQTVELTTHDGWSGPKGRQVSVLNF
jgi:hypothetical protein